MYGGVALRLMKHFDFYGFVMSCAGRSQGFLTKEFFSVVDIS